MDRLILMIMFLGFIFSFLFLLIFVPAWIDDTKRKFVSRYGIRFYWKEWWKKPKVR